MREICGLAQLVELLPCKQMVAGSSPAAGTSFIMQGGVAEWLMVPVLKTVEGASLP